MIFWEGNITYKNIIMATATKQDDDLLIITDEDTNSDTSGEIEFSFDFGDDSSAPTKETTTPEAAIEKADLKVEDSVMATPDISLSDEAVVTDEVTVPDTIPAKEELLDISFDISDTPADTVVDMTAKQDTPSEDVSFDLTGEDTDASSKLAVGAMSIKTAKSVVSPTETPEVAEAASESSMNEILSTTIILKNLKIWSSTQ